MVDLLGLPSGGRRVCVRRFDLGREAGEMLEKVMKEEGGFSR